MNTTLNSGAPAPSEENILEIRNMVIHYETKEGVVEAVNNFSLDIRRGETMGLVGETGAGKTTVALSTIGLLPVPPSHVIQGEVLFEGENLLEKSQKEMRKIRGEKIGMIFQDPMSALNPVQYVGDQIAEVIRLHQHCGKGEAQVKAMEMLRMVGIPENRYKEYPHQFSGGMKQRVIIAIALACEPDLIIADEPTTALDVTIQAQVLNLLQDLQEEKHLTYLFITHDLSVVKHISDEICVMYLGQVVEQCESKELFRNPLHPYSNALLSAIPIPSVDNRPERTLLQGEIVSPVNPPACCRFAARCPYATDQCRKEAPQLQDAGGGGLAAACHAAELGVKPILVLEKRPYYGGNSGMAGGWIFGVQSRVQREAGSSCCAEDVYAEALNYHHFERVNAELLWNLIKRSGYTIDWLEAQGAEYMPDGEQCHMPTHLNRDFGYFRNYIDLIKNNFEGMGGTVQTNARVTAIGTEDQAIKSVTYLDEKTGETCTVETDAVVLATGGFCGNDELLEKYFPEQFEPNVYLTDAIPMDGDGIGLAENAGAKLNDYCTLLKEPNYSFMRRNSAPNRIGGIHFALWVNQEGRRYCKEDTPAANALANVLLQQPGKEGYAIFDSQMIDDIMNGRRDFPMMAVIDRSSIKSYLESESRRWVCISDSMDEIAKWIGVDPAVLSATVEEYNHACLVGEDSRFGKNPENLLPLKTGPYYAVRFCPLIIDTFGPVVTDREMRVQGTNGEPIKGFYAAGVISAGWQGRDYYLRGGALGLTLATGLLAAETVSKDFQTAAE